MRSTNETDAMARGTAIHNHCEAHARAQAHPRISLDNGQSTRGVGELSDAQVTDALAHAEAMDDEIREALHRDEWTAREFLAEYCERHEAKHGAVWTLP